MFTVASLARTYFSSLVEKPERTGGQASKLKDRENSINIRGGGEFDW
jgi:hypothetical protein